jgi:hypothetical protein
MNWNAVSDLGSPSAMALAAVLIAIWLICSRVWFAAIRWVSLFCAAALLVIGTKIAFGPSGLGRGPLDFTGISGHATSATAVLGVAGSLLGGGPVGDGTVAAGAIGYGLGVLIGASTLLSQPTHSLFEVIAGSALGGLVALLSIRSIPKGSSGIVAPGIFALSLACIFLAAYAKITPSEEWIGGLASHLTRQGIPPLERTNSNAPAPAPPNTALGASGAPTTATVNRIDVNSSTKTNTIGASTVLSAEAFKPDVAQSEFGKYCAPPIPPPCFQKEETYKEPANIEACKKEIDEYINEALKYRTCVEDQIMSFVKSANDVIDAFRCRTQGRSSCPQQH